MSRDLDYNKKGLNISARKSLPLPYHFEAHRRSSPYIVALFRSEPESLESKELLDEIQSTNGRIRQWNNDNNLPDELGTIDIRTFQHAWANPGFTPYLEGFCKIHNYPMNWARDPPEVGSEYCPYRAKYWEDCNWAVGGILFHCLWQLLKQNAREVDDLEDMIRAFECAFNKDLSRLHQEHEDPGAICRSIQLDPLINHYQILAKRLEEQDKNNPNQMEIERILSGQKDEYVRILEVEQSDTERAKVKAYRKKSLLVHPDKNGNSKMSKKAFKWLQGAMMKLKDPKTQMPDPLNVEGGKASWHPGAFESGSEEDSADDEGTSNTEEHALPSGQQSVPPSPVRKIYESADIHVKSLLENPANMTAKAEIEKADLNIQNYISQSPESQRGGPFGINLGLLCRVAERGAELQKKARAKPPDEVTIQDYEDEASTLAGIADNLGWPSDWRLAPLYQDDDGYEIRRFYCRANKDVKILMRYPQDQRARERVERINGDIETYEPKNMIDRPSTIDISRLCEYYEQSKPFLSRLENDPNDMDAWRKAVTIRDEMERWVSDNKYPTYWLPEVPTTTSGSQHTSGSSAAETKSGSSTSMTRGDRPKLATTRDGELICGHKKWKRSRDADLYCWQFAILPDPTVSIGEIRSGTKLGKDSKQGYLQSGATNEVRKHVPSDKGRFKEVEAVFVHPSTRQEIWVLFRLTGPDDEESCLMTRTEFTRLREGIDANYDIAQHFEENGMPVPSTVKKHLPAGRVPATFSATRQKPRQIEMGRNNEGRDDETKMEDIIEQMRQQKIMDEAKQKQAQNRSRQTEPATREIDRLKGEIDRLQRSEGDLSSEEMQNIASQMSKLLVHLPLSGTRK
ncbi:hypothetical protein BDV59DRAFT_206479 [Aspergillus ambiguus]|uniref:uncharacterized protein n=1 Tax=Aspergillus ambiguus TaxID=176160 RepID=UPI003CCC9764